MSEQSLSSENSASGPELTVLELESREQIHLARQSINDVVRLLSLGFLLFFYLVVTDENGISQFSNSKYIVAFVGAAGFLGFLLDYLNSLAKLRLSHLVYKAKSEYNEHHVLYVCAVWLFRSKQIFCFFGGLALSYLFLEAGIAKLFPL